MLKVRWKRKDGDIWAWAPEKSVALLALHTLCDRTFTSQGLGTLQTGLHPMNPSFIEQLTEAGYDISTLQLTCKKRK